MCKWEYGRAPNHTLPLRLCYVSPLALSLAEDAINMAIRCHILKVVCYVGLVGKEAIHVCSKGTAGQHSRVGVLLVVKCKCTITLKWWDGGLNLQ